MSTPTGYPLQGAKAIGSSFQPITFFITLLCTILFLEGMNAEARAFNIHTRDGAILSGVLEVPRTRPLKAIALIIQGSGNIDASGDVSSPYVGIQGYHGGRTDLSVQIAEEFSKNGIASLRYSKRGKDEPARLSEQTIDYIANDAADALNTLSMLYPKTRLILVGFSEGAIVASLVAQKFTNAAIETGASPATIIDKLVLMALPAQTFDQLLQYQFVEWPLEMAMKSDLLTATRLETLQQNLSALLDSINTLPQFKNLKAWMDSMQILPKFENIAKSIITPVYLFHGADDSQVRASTNLAIARFFPNLKDVHAYPGLGHCFSPFDGTNRDVKTSGPIQDYVLKDLAAAALQ